MERETDRELLVCEHCGHTVTADSNTGRPDSSDATDPGANPLEVRRPPLLELTTPSGRTWYVVNPN
jgi:hypothetical protein